MDTYFRLYNRSCQFKRPKLVWVLVTFSSLETIFQDLKLFQVWTPFFKIWKLFIIFWTYFFKVTADLKRPRLFWDFWCKKNYTKPFKGSLHEKFEKVCPKLEKVCSKLEKMCQKLEKMCQKLEKMCQKFSVFSTKVW